MRDAKAEEPQVSVLDDKPCSVTLSVEIAQAAVSTETDKVYNEIQKNAQIPGFRQGKAPMELVKKSHTSAAREKIIENLVKQTYYSALKSKSIEPIDFPVIEEIKFDFDKPFTFKMKAERHPQFKIRDYKGIKIVKQIIPVTDEKVNEVIQSLRERNAKLVQSNSDTVEAKHFVTVDYECFHGGKSLSDFKGRGQLVDLSAPQNLAGFREGLLGARKEEEKQFNVKLPGDYLKKDLAGQEITFKVKVLEIKEKQLPELHDELAKDFGAADLSELKTKIKESLEEERKAKEKQEVEKQILDHLLKHNEFPVPDSLVEEQLNYLIKRSEDYAKKRGINQQNWEKNLPALREKYRVEAEHNVRISYILNAVAKEEKIETGEEAMRAELENLKKTNPDKTAEVEKYFLENKDHIESGVRERAIFKFLTENAKIKEEIKNQR